MVAIKRILDERIFPGVRIQKNYAYCWTENLRLILYFNISSEYTNNIR
jgi:hypothetical protein